jgi:hypothetical protein
VDTFQLSPGVVIDPNRSEAFVMDPEGEIVAVDLASGSEVWRSQKAAKPLAVAGDILVGQAEQPGPANALKIVALDTSRQGQPVTESLVQLPPNVHPMIDQAANRSFTARALPQAGEATLAWEFVERPLRGIAPGPLQVLPGEAPPAPTAMGGAPAAAASASARLGAQPTVMRGEVRINLSSGAVAPSPAPPTASPATMAPSGPVAADVPSGATIAGVPLPQFLSVDGRHILSSARIADDPEWDKYLWTLYDRATGAGVGAFRAHLRYAPFFVTNSRAIYQTPPYARKQGANLVEEPPQIHAMDLATGSELWNHAVRDTTDRRPRPP